MAHPACRWSEDVGCRLPAMNNVGVDAMGQGDPCNGCVNLSTFLYDLGFKLRTVISPLGARGINPVRTGVHYIHSGHYRLEVTSNQYGFATRLR